MSGRIVLSIINDRKHKATNKTTGAVELRFTLDRKQKYFATGVNILKGEWRNGKVVRRKDAQELNDRIDAYASKAESIITQVIENDGNLDDVMELMRGEDKGVPDFVSYCVLRSERRKVREGTRKRYNVFINFLKEWKGIKDFGDVTVAKVREMDELLHGRGLGQATVYNYHKSLKLFVRDAIVDGYMEKNPYNLLPFKIGRGEKEFVDCLTPEQFEAVKALKIKTPHIERARDLFLFQCYTGVAYSDLMSFDFELCEESGGKYFYRAKRTKTDTDFTFQLLTPAIEILRKYDFVLPKISSQKYNDYLKVIGGMVGAPEMHSHMGRATAATMFLSKGMPLNVVSSVLGHKTIRQTQRYARTLSKDVKSAFDMLEGKM